MQHPRGSAVTGDKEAALGAQFARELQARTTAVDNPEVSNYMGQLAQKLAVYLPANAPAYRIGVIEDATPAQTHEPFAFPGGYVFVSTDLISAAHDEAEFAGMLAHAMAHSAYPVMAKPVVNYGSVPLVFLGGWGGNEQMGVTLGLIKVRQAEELKADGVAVRVMASAGYDPTSLVRYIERTQPVAKLVWSNLPPRGERGAAMQAAIGELPAKTYSVGEEFARVQEAVRTPEPVRPHKVPTLFRPDEQH